MDRLTNGIDYCKMHCDFGKSNECFFQDKSKCYEKNIYEKLREYENLEEQGLLLRFPCKLGTSVYMVEQDCGGDILDCMRVDCEGCPYLYSFVEENKFDAYMLENIGNTVFVTKSEDEAKLKELRCNND